MTTTDYATPPPSANAVAGRYQLLEAIGSGGAASVYRARDTVLGRDVALKVFRAESVVADELVRQEREIRMLSGLQHPGLISVFDAGRQNFDGSIRRFVVMELVSHASLEKVIEAGALAPHDVAGIGAQIADALAYVHEQGVVHRDVKPANILIGDGGAGGFRRRAKLGDFGIAHYLGGHRMTSDGTILGTAAYLSPEQVTGGEVTVSSDVYSLGLVLLEALTGVQEFPGTVIESAIARTNRDATIPDELAEEWQLLLGAMTSRVPSERPSAAEVAAILHGQPEPALTGTGRRSKGSRLHRRNAFRGLRSRRNRNVGLIVGVTALVAGAFLLGLWLGAVLLG
ncbi:serine/threonine-protein kinase [Schumannella sp. 10F1B-5-1]|uniref:serine/threonine-protein kinase n=1 Tax=Schumannella sp. 10F1B-5-1 TaxID=2590780 RepID=UPI001130E463|nr:serine/threonine-protein kinase [Schumannella sp. 10F1B-5-1]TPW76843.1 serine/threonine protein kinase [Schumannella sp. 10F1B-5-1]